MDKYSMFLDRKKTDRGIRLSDFRLYYKVTVITLNFEDLGKEK